MKKISVSGTKEWSSESANIQYGCEHNCRYCYARANALRFKLIGRPKDWPNIRNKPFPRKYFKKVKGTIMFPTVHDITPENIIRAGTFLIGVLKAGNNILIVSKPHFSCITNLCFILDPYKDQVLFRFTIGTINNYVLRFWEPNAPSYGERKECLIHAFKEGFKTSVSVEPMLTGGMIELAEDLLPYITDAIWFGKMNRVSERVDTTGWTQISENYLNEINEINKPLNIMQLYGHFKNNPQVKWKESIKKVVGIATPKEIGLDI